MAELTHGELPASKSFIVFKRNEQRCYIFQQILENCFPRVPQSTVRRWLRTIGKSVIRTNSLERQHLNRLGLIPYRYLIAEDNLFQLMEHSKTRRKYNKKQPLLSAESHVSSIVNVCLPSTIVHRSSNTISDEIPQSSSVNSCAIMDDVSNANILPVSLLDKMPDAISFEAPQTNTVENDFTNATDEINDELPQSNSVNSSTIVGEVPNLSMLPVSLLHKMPDAISFEAPETTTVESDVTNVSEEINDEVSPSTNLVNSSTNILPDSFVDKLPDAISVEVAQLTHSVDNSVDNCSTSSHDKLSIVKIGCLERKDTCPELQIELDRLSDFYTIAVNPLRTCSAFSASTMRKFLERVKCFLNFCRIKYPERKLDFSLVNDVDIVQAYTTYQLEERKLNISTVVRTITALINLVKYVHRASKDVNSCVHLIHLKNVQRQLSQRQQSHRLATKAGLCDAKTSTFMFQHLLDTIKSLREKVDSYRGSPTHTRILHDFVLISLYVTSMCGRSKEVRTLQLFKESEGKQFHFDWRTKCNVFVVSADEDKFTLYENDFKNLRSHGPSKFDIDCSMWLIPYVKEYIRKRTDLLCGQSHSFMFMSITGLAFTSSSFTLYLGDLFEKEVHIRAGTTKLRHALVTHVLSLPEAESLRLRESLAVLMRHSLKHQQTTYCDISRQERTFLSLDLVNKSVEKAAVKRTRTESSAESSLRKVCEEPSQPCEISVGDMVGLLDSASTCAEDAIVFVGRVVKIRANEALLMEFRKIDGHETLYRAVVDSSWWENLNSIIYPIDIIYQQKEQAYELRSTVAEIYHAVYAEH